MYFLTVANCTLKGIWFERKLTIFVTCGFLYSNIIIRNIQIRLTKISDTSESCHCESKELYLRLKQISKTTAESSLT